MKTLRTTDSSSVTRRTLIYNLQDDDGNGENGSDVRNFQLDLTPPPDVVMRTKPGTSEGMNVLGIVIFSATMGKKSHTNTHNSSMLHTQLHTHNTQEQFMCCLDPDRYCILRLPQLKVKSVAQTHQACHSVVSNASAFCAQALCWAGWVLTAVRL